MRGLNEELLPVLLPILRHKPFAQNSFQSHTLNGCRAKLASNMDAKVVYSLYLSLDNIKNVFFQLS